MNKNNTPQNTKPFQKVWDKFKDSHKTENYQLKGIFEIHLPFWQCKQSIVVERDIELDRFSRIILELINTKITKYNEICLFLGIAEDSFVTIQFHFLLKNDLIREEKIGEYHITHEGIAFLENKTKIKNIDNIEFEYFVTEATDYLKNDLTQKFFNPNTPIDSILSVGKKQSFLGYKVMDTRKIQRNIGTKEIPHNNRPTFQQINAQRNDFSQFFNTQFQDKTFYDFANAVMEAHKRNICFYALHYQHTQNQDDLIIDIRQSSKSTTKFTTEELENTLTKEVTQYYKQNPSSLK